MTDVRLTALNPEDSKVYPVACNSSGELLTDKVDIGPNISIEGNLDVGGTITAVGGTSITNYNSEFASTVLSRWTSDFNTPNGTVCTINSDGSITAAGLISSSDAVMCKLGENRSYLQPGLVEALSTTKDTTKAFRIQGGRGGASAQDVVTMTTDGSATFAGSIDLPTNNSFITGGGHNVFQVDATRTYLYGGGAGIQFRNADNSAEIATVDNNGSATFSGSVTAGSAVETSSSTFAVMGDDGHLVLQNNAGTSGQRVFTVFNGLYSNDNIKIQFFANGDGLFKGTVTAGGFNIDALPALA